MYAFSVLGIQQATIDGHLSTVKFFHRVSSSLELDTRHPLIRNGLKGVARGHAQVATQQQVRRPMALLVLRSGVTLAPQWGVGGRVLFLALGASFFFFARASDMFAVSKDAMGVEHGLRPGDVAFFKRAVQLSVGQWHLSDRVELSFGSSKGDQFRKERFWHGCANTGFYQ